MATRTNRFARAAAATALLLAPLTGAAEAAVSEVTPKPARAQVATTGASSLTVAWQVDRTLVSPPPGPGTIASQRAELLIDGMVVGSIPQRLARATEGSQIPERLVFEETLVIPQAFVFRAIKLASPLVVRRSFADSFESGEAAASVTVVPSGPGSAGLTVQRLALAFDDESRVRVLAEASSLRAVAEITTSGAGLISGQWEVASASTTDGVPVFRPLTLVRQGVGASGRTVITSPPLPTAVEGSNLVRFRITTPETSFAEPLLRYYVTAPTQGRILTTKPFPDEVLSEETRFAWSALAGVAAYHLELFAAPGEAAVPDGTALAGIFVSAEQTAAHFNHFSLAYIPADRRYLWKVSAIDAKGAVIGSSSVREIYRP
ncbi:hypothetical protein [Pelagibius sp.]|uniref:hypothetical protein n=1 Tax=Pelagibius sp. TaxID=1931238 RepID=UPI002625C1C2|nr:hypothetical protein [Pelagibius sp.]